MAESLRALLANNALWWGIGRAAIIFVGFAVAAWLLLQLLRTVVRRLTRATDTRLDDELLRAVRPPLALLVVLFGLDLALAQLPSWPENAQRTIDALFFLAFTFVLYLLVYRALRAIMSWYIDDFSRRTSSSLDEAIAPFMQRVLLLVLTVGVAIFVLQHFQVPIGSLIATLGIGSLAVALAAQSTLSDLFAGFFIMLDRRYRVGDRIELVTADIVGDVVDIGLRTTRILTMDHRMVIVPNTMLASNIVINHAYPDPNLRVDLPIGVAYGTDIDEVKQILITALRGIKGVHPNRSADVIFTGFGDSALELEVRCWINAYADKPKLIGRINEAIYKALNAAGIEIPFPQRVVWTKENSNVETLKR